MLVRRLAAMPRARRVQPASQDLLYVADALRRVLCARVLLEGSEHTGRVVIEYHSREELERLCQQIAAPRLPRRWAEPCPYGGTLLGCLRGAAPGAGPIETSG